MSDCIFCEIVRQSDPNTVIYQDDTVTAFYDRSPRTPVHILVVPNKHFVSMLAVQEQDETSIGHMLKVGAHLAAENGLDKSGFRLVINTGRDAGQSVFHLHLHVLGGRSMPFDFGGG
jgi:diadenosine tetraphosphate (Ap4A) HIT family hydrolase